jgi:hypothetical protein
MTDFEETAKRQVRHSIVREYWMFLRTNKKWWLVPILFFLFVFAVLVALSGTAAAPFVYTLF